MSESTQDLTNEGGEVNSRRGVKKSHKYVRTPLPLGGAPLSRVIALNSVSQGRRRKGGDAERKAEAKGQRKEASKGQQLPLVSSPISSHFVGDAANFELQVVLPFPGSGIDQLVDSDGEVVPETAEVLGEGRISEEEEASRLMGIQAMVGFTFEGGEDEVQKRLVEVERKDRVINGVRVQGMGYQ
jgi:hypothetical protein